MRNSPLWKAPQFRLLSVFSSISLLTVTEEALDVCWCVCVRVWVWHHIPKRADRRCATHLRNFPKTAGLLPVHSLTLNQPQSAACLLKCLQPCQCVRVCVCVWLFIIFVVSLCDCLQKPFSQFCFLLLQNVFMIKHGEVSIPFFFHCF